MAQSFNTSLKNVASNYLQLLYVNVTPSSVEKDIEENPYYPSLLSLSDTFDKYKIKNSAYEIAAEDLDQLEAPFVAFVNMPVVGKDFVLVTDIGKEAITYLHQTRTPQVLSKSDFLAQYQNIIWAAEPDEESGEIGYHEKMLQQKTERNRRYTWITASILLLLLLIAAGFDAAHMLAFGSIALFKLTGLATAVLLLLYEADKDNPFVKNICSTGKKTDCDAVLDSRMSKILGIGWSEIGFFYFASTTLWLLYPSLGFAAKIPWLALANVLAVPYVLFSIYYQWRVVKQWCPLCLTVQAVLVAECGWAVFNHWSTSPGSYGFAGQTLLPAAICLLLPILAWSALKPVFAKAKDARLYTAAYKRLQYNREIFRSLLLQQDKAPDGWQQLGIDIGHPEAAHTIIKVCSPYCGPCAKAHPEFEKLADLNPDLQLKIIFTSRNLPNDGNAMVARHLLSIAAAGDIPRTKQALDDWYLADTKKYELFADKYPSDGSLDQQNLKLEAMSQWCRQADILHTPTFFVNGYRLPENYHIEDLKHIL